MFTDFIGVFDNFLTPKECQIFIDYFNHMKELDLVYDRQSMKDGKAHHKDDETGFVMQFDSLPVMKANPIMKTFFDKFWKAYGDYAEEFSILHDIEKHGILSARLQKTEPGGGYHDWHCESAGFDVSTRVTVFSLYLNDVEHGGETEFLYQKRRLSAKAGRLVVWPAAFTHTHRGNPPLSNEKYILTGWLQYFGEPK